MRAAGVDPLLNNRIRAGIIAFVSDRGAVSFVEAADALDLANNSLSSHLRALENAGYVELRRGFFNRKPRTRIVMTPTGRSAWRAHLTALESGLPS